MTHQDTFRVNQHIISIDGDISKACYNRLHRPYVIGTAREGIVFKHVLEDYLDIPTTEDGSVPIEQWQPIIKIFKTEMARHRNDPGGMSHAAMVDIATAIENKLAGKKRQRIGKGVYQWV